MSQTVHYFIFVIIFVQCGSEYLQKCEYPDKVLDRLDRLEKEVRNLRQENKILRLEVTRPKSEFHNVDKRTSVKSQDSKRLIDQDIIPQLTASAVAFSAVLSPELNAHIGPHHVFIYDHIESNFGGGYSNNTGVFTSPKPGIFAFLWTIAAEGTNTAGSGNYGEVETELIVNAKKRGYARTDTEVSWDDDQTTGFVIVQLNKADVVYVRTSADTPQGNMQHSYHGSWTFSGWQIA